jgi:hypothetical protein
MTVSAVLALLSEIVANLPAAVTTGQQVIQLVNSAYNTLSDSLADEDIGATEVDALVAKIVRNSAAVQALD